MPDLPVCLQPAVEQIEKYQTQILALEAKTDSLNEHVQDLSSKNERLVQQVQDESALHNTQVEKLEAEKTTLHDLNVVVGDQLKEKSSLVDELSVSKNALEEKNSQVSSESLRINVEQEALSQKTEVLGSELETLKSENASLKEENSALSLVNSAMHQRQTDRQDVSVEDNPILVAEIQSLKQELQSLKSGSTDLSFLQSENHRLTMRHGEITQEKMSASSKMHTAQNALQGVQDKLDAATKTNQQLDFDLRGLQNLHKNLNDEKNSHVQDNKLLESVKDELNAKILHLEEEIQGLETEKELVEQNLAKAHKKADTLTQVINELRLKNEKLKAGVTPVVNETPKAQAPEVKALEIKETADEDIEIVRLSSTGPTFPGER